MTLSYSELPLTAISSWDIDSVRRAMTGLQRGYFRRAASLGDSVIADSRIAPVLDTRINAVLRLPYSLEVTDDAQEAARDELLPQIDRLFPDSIMREVLRHGLLLGAAPVEMTWRLDDPRRPRRMMPELSAWHPQNLYYELGQKVWRLESEEGPVELDFGEGKWLLFRPFGHKYPFLHGLIRRLATLYLIRTYVERDWNRWSERHGIPIYTVHRPDDATDEEINEFRVALEDMGAEGLVDLPSRIDSEGNVVAGWSLSFLEPRSQSHLGFRNLKRAVDTDAAIAVLGQNLTTEVEGGSFAAAQIQNRVRLDYLEADAAALAGFQHDVLRCWAELNLGNPDLAPKPFFDTTPPKEETQIEEWHARAGVIRRNELRARLNLPALGDDEGGNDFVELPGSTGGGEPAMTPQRRARIRSLARLVVEQRRGAGQESIGARIYLERLIEHGAAQSREASDDLYGRVRTAIEDATDERDLEQRLIEAYVDAPAPQAEHLEQIFTLADLVGRAAIEEEPA